MNLLGPKKLSWTVADRARGKRRDFVLHSDDHFEPYLLFCF